jgi:hypothetical protein
MVMDISKASEPPLPAAVTGAESPTISVPQNNEPVTSIDLDENPKVRTKLQVYAILTALYVGSPKSSIGRVA